MARLTAMVEGVQAETVANRDRHHRNGNIIMELTAQVAALANGVTNLKPNVEKIDALETKLAPIIDAWPATRDQVANLNNLKNQGFGVLLAVGALAGILGGIGAWIAKKIGL